MFSKAPFLLSVWWSCSSTDLCVPVKGAPMLELTIDQSINAINVVISVKQKFQKPYL